jgi:hypothetical protein
MVNNTTKARLGAARHKPRPSRHLAAMDHERPRPAAPPGGATGRPINPEAALQLTDRGRELLGRVRGETGDRDAEQDRASPTDGPQAG